jgi:two-component system NtrC family sensor kinase
MEYSEKLYKQAQRTHRIVQNLLSFARQHKPERLPTMINHILEDTLALRDYDLRMSNIRVHLNLAPDLPVMSADPHQLQQVFLNMVNNAVDAILESSADGDLWVTTRADKTRVFVEFTDSGPGVQEASRVFDPFYTTKPVGKGTGLGLSICYGIVTEHGGTIRVRNLPHRGASFTIELPLDGSPKSGSGNLQTDNAERPGLVLCVDSDYAVLQSLNGILDAREYEVHAAKNGDELRGLIDKYDFDVILADCDVLDAQLSKSFYDWLTEHRPAFSQRLIRMYTRESGNDAFDEKATGRLALTKPLDKGQLLDAINVLLSARTQPATVVR